MSVSGIDSLFGTQELTETEKMRRDRKSKGVLEQLGGGEDTVTLSDEGKRLAAEMQARKTQEQEEQEKRENASKDLQGKSTAGALPAEDSTEEEAGGAAAAQGGGGGGSGSSDSAESIKKQIQQLEAKLQTIASSGLPENVKESTMATYQAQIAELQAQLQQAQQG